MEKKVEALSKAVKDILTMLSSHNMPLDVVNQAVSIQAELATTFEPPKEPVLIENLVTTPVTPKPTVTGNIVNYLVGNAGLNDPQPFVVARIMPGFTAMLNGARYTSGQPIRSGGVLQVVADTPPEIPTLICCELFHPFGRLGGSLYLWARPFATQHATVTAFTFELAGSGSGTTVVNFHNV